MKKEVTLKRILINAAFIAVVVIALAIAAHFILRAGTRHGVRRIVPELKGISLSEAKLLAKESDLEIFINDSLYVTAYPGGTVLDQLPAGGVEVKPGRTVYIVINAFGKRMVQVPYVANRSLRQAKNMLDVAGLEIKNIKYIPDMATNYVLSQSFEGKSISSASKVEAPEGSGIELTVGVSQDDPYTTTPNVVGLSIKEAKSRIWESGLNMGKINIDKGVNLLKDKNAKVYIQGVAANTAARWGQSMSITVTLDNTKIESAVKVAAKAEAEYEKQLAEEEASNGEEQETADENDSSQASQEDEAYDFFE
ncbi:MAG: PASTA domain-containing protein [Rikenellaceae bacterium]